MDNRWPAVAALLSLSVCWSCDEGAAARQDRSLVLRFPEALIEGAPGGPVELQPITIGGDERTAIFAPAPARIRFPSILIQPEEVLRFGIGLPADTAEPAGAAVEFRVALTIAGQRTRLWSRRLGLDEPREDRRWEEVQLDLADHSGKRVDLQLETARVGEANAAWGAWSSPVLSGRRPTNEGTLDPVQPARIERNLLDGVVPPLGFGTFDYAGQARDVELLAAHRTALGSAKAAKGGPGVDPSASSLFFTLHVPEGGRLELGGEVLAGRGPEPRRLGPVEFAVAIDGRSVFRRTLGASDLVFSYGDATPVPERFGATFHVTLPLDRHVGQRVGLELGIEKTEPARSAELAWWTSASVLRTQEVPRSQSGSGRNLLIVLVDTLRPDHLGLYGHRSSPSPNLDRLAPSSRVFEQAVSSSSWTQPATATLLTGLSPLTHGVVGGAPLPARIESLASVLQQAGFSTMGLSANPIVGRREGFHRGFETFAEIGGARAPELTELFQNWLAENRSSRWFAYLHYMDPHEPYDPPREFVSGAQRAQCGTTQAELEKDLRCLSGAYDGEILFWDSQFGLLIERLREQGVLDDTLLVVVGDHGEEFMEHGKLYHGQQLFQESTRVPLVLRGPGLVPPGRHPEPVALENVMTTLLDLLGVRPGSGDAESRHLLSGTPHPVFSHTALGFTPGRGYWELAAVQSDGWKYILDVDAGTGKLFDLRNDPDELEDRSSTHPALERRYRASLKHWLDTTRATAHQAPDPALLRELRALGYVGE